MIKDFKANVPYPIFLIRHGKVDYNKRFEDGGYVDVHGQISPIGIEQVNLAIQELVSAIDAKGINIITSPKRRCYQTADLLITALEKDSTVTVTVDSGFRDVDILTHCENRPQGSYAVWESGLKDGETWLDGWKKCKKYFEGEETPQTLNKRVATTFQKLVIDAPTIIVCHEEVMLALADHFEIQTSRPTYAEVWQINPLEA